MDEQMEEINVKTFLTDFWINSECILLRFQEQSVQTEAIVARESERNIFRGERDRDLRELCCYLD
jgi:hypothetical protein